MLGLFFQKNDKITFLGGETYLRVSNNLDSHYYVLERVKDGGSQYISANYFSSSHPQLIEYYTSWKEKELIQQEAPIIKKPKDKRSLIGGLLSKKSKLQSKPTFKQTKEQIHVAVTEEDALYVQLQSFSEVNVPTDFEEAKEFMALIYLLSMRIYEKFNSWPQMIPVITESKRYKFIKKGNKLEQELVRLFDFTFKQAKMKALQTWSSELYSKVSEAQTQEDKKSILGTFIHAQLQLILQNEYLIRLKKPQEWQNLTVTIQDAFTLVFKQTSQQIAIDQYEISYYHQDSQTRQIIMQHNIENTLILQGKRSNLIIKYLKQFVIG